METPRWNQIELFLPWGQDFKQRRELCRKPVPVWGSRNNEGKWEEAGSGVDSKASQDMEAPVFGVSFTELQHKSSKNTAHQQTWSRTQFSCFLTLSNKRQHQNRGHALGVLEREKKKKRLILYQLLTDCLFVVNLLTRLAQFSQ